MRMSMVLALLVAATVAACHGYAQMKTEPKLETKPAPKVEGAATLPNEIPLTESERRTNNNGPHATSHVILAPVPAGMVAVNDPTDGGRYLVAANDVKEIARLRDLVAARVAGKAPLTVISDTPIQATCEGGQCCAPVILPAPGFTLRNSVNNCPNGRCPNQR